MDLLKEESIEIMFHLNFPSAKNEEFGEYMIVRIIQVPHPEDIEEAAQQEQP